MLFLVDTHAKTATSLPVATFASLALRERYDIQEWVLNTPALVGEDLLVVSTEFHGWDRTAERLDVLAVDRQGKLVVIELKRTAVGTAAELQALRYAAYCSTLSLDDVAELFVRHVGTREGTSPGVEDARTRIKEFIANPQFDTFDDKPRIILAAEEFPPEITATVLWLRDYRIEMSCVRLVPYWLDGRLMVDSNILIPLPETQQYMVRKARKEVELDSSRDVVPTIEEFIGRTGPEIQLLVQRFREWMLSRRDVQESVGKTLLSYRAVSDNAWLSWVELTRKEMRVALPPEAALDQIESLPTNYGWTKALVRSADDLQRVIDALAVDYGRRYITLSTADTEPWNGRDFYVSLGVGVHRDWEDCRRYGFISAGQGSWYSNSLRALEPGHRVFVYIPKTGYVGVGTVREGAVPVKEFLVHDANGAEIPILAAPVNAARMGENAEDAEKTEFLVRVDWVKTVSLKDALYVKGMFANQNSACRLTHTFTRDRLVEFFQLPD